VAVLIDSDVLIEVFRARDNHLVQRWEELERSDTAIEYSPVSAAELYAGMRPGESERLMRLFESLRCVPIDAEIGIQAGHFIRQYSKSHSLDIADALIAASASVSGAALWTRNRKHFPMKELLFF